MNTSTATHVPFRVRDSATLAVADHEGSFEALLQGLEFLPGEGRRLAAVLRSFAARDGYYVGADLLPVAGRDDLLVARWGSAWGYSGRRSWEVEILLAKDITSYALNTRGGWEAVALRATTSSADGQGDHEVPMLASHHGQYDVHLGVGRWQQGAFLLQQALRRRLVMDGANARAEWLVANGHTEAVEYGPGEEPWERAFPGIPGESADYGPGYETLVAAGGEALAAAYKPEETADVSWVGVAIPHTGPYHETLVAAGDNLPDWELALLKEFGEQA